MCRPEDGTADSVASSLPLHNVLSLDMSDDEDARALANKQAEPRSELPAYRKTWTFPSNMPLATPDQDEISVALESPAITRMLARSGAAVVDPATTAGMKVMAADALATLAQDLLVMRNEEPPQPSAVSNLCKRIATALQDYVLRFMAFGCVRSLYYELLCTIARAFASRRARRLQSRTGHLQQLLLQAIVSHVVKVLQRVRDHDRATAMQARPQGAFIRPLISSGAYTSPGAAQPESSVLHRPRGGCTAHFQSRRSGQASGGSDGLGQARSADPDPQRCVRWFGAFDSPRLYTAFESAVLQRAPGACEIVVPGTLREP
jgi:hypothetical protein